MKKKFRAPYPISNKRIKQEKWLQPIHILSLKNTSFGN